MFEDRKREANICTQKKTCRLEKFEGSWEQSQRLRELREKEDMKPEMQSSRIVQKTVEGAGDGWMSVTIVFLFAGCLVKAIGFLAS